MGLTSRKKRPLDRVIAPFRDARLFIVATEGERTEQGYFESEGFKSPRVHLHILPTRDGRSSPGHIMHRLKDFEGEYELDPKDELWLVLDRDRWPQDILSEIAAWSQQQQQPSWGMAISNPCFELWLYLHLADWDGGEVSCGEITAALRSLLGGYNKSNIDISKFADGIDDAVRRAETLDTNPSGRWPDNPGTYVYRLVRSIRELIARQ